MLACVCSRGGEGGTSAPAAAAGAGGVGVVDALEEGVDIFAGGVGGWVREGELGGWARGGRLERVWSTGATT